MLKILFNKFKIVCLSIQNKIFSVLIRIFTKSNLIKCITIFALGFISRILLSTINDGNIFSNYLYQIFAIYYFFLYFFIVLINEFTDYFHLTLNVNNFSKAGFKYKTYKFYTMDSVEEGSSSNNKEKGYNDSANSNRPVHNRIRDLRYSEKKYDPSQDHIYLEKEKIINKYKEEFKEFYSTNKESIKLTTDDLEKLTIKVANKLYNTGSVSAVMDILPADIQSLYKKFLRKQLLDKVRFSSTR